jgi:hypothetical protein
MPNRQMPPPFCQTDKLRYLAELEKSPTQNIKMQTAGTGVVGRLPVRLIDDV